MAATGGTTGETGGAATGGTTRETGGAATGGTTRETGGTGGSTIGCSGLPASVIYCNDFDDDPLGNYSASTLGADWGAPPWNNGVTDGRVSIVSGADAFSGRSLRVAYPQGAVGPAAGGAQWEMPISGNHTELFLSYRVRFAAGFGFVLGGKLPGLVGGTVPSGGNKPNGTDGFSARMMWRQGGKAVQYMYYMDQVSNYGDDFNWNLNGQELFQPGQWHQVEHRIKMNTPGVADGIVEGWFDGTKALSRTNMRFRASGGSFVIDGLYFSTFFGGNTADWEPTRNETVDFDDFILATAPIAH